MKSLFASKTFWLGVVVSLLPVLESFTAVQFEPEWLYRLLGVVIVALRFITSQPVTLRK